MQRSQRQQARANSATFPQEVFRQQSARGYFPRIRGARSTSATPRTFHRSDEHLKGISRAVNTFKSEYHGGKHAAWAKTLFRELGPQNKISIPQIEEYATKITEHIDTIKHWSIQHIFDVFTHLSRAGFFIQINNLGTAKEEIINLRNELIKQLNSNFEQMPLSPENQNSFVALLWGICDQINVENEISPVVHNLLLKLNASFMNASFFLTTYNYKEISNAISAIIIRANSYKSIFNTVIEKHLDHMVKFAENEEIDKNNKFFAIYLSNIAKLIKHNFIVSPNFGTNIVKLINHTDLTENNRTATSGLQSITAILEKKEIALEDATPVIKKCLRYLEDKKLELEDISLILISISRYAMYLKDNVANEIPKYLTEKIDYYLNSLIEHKENLSFIILTSLLRVFSILITMEYPVIKNLEKIIPTYNKEKEKFLQLSKNDLHSVITSIGEISKKMKSKYQKYYAVEFAPFLNTLMPRYMLESQKAPLSEIMNSVQALTELMECGFLANSKMKETYNHLFMIIDEKRQELTDCQLIDHIRNITMCFGLLSLDLTKIQEYKEQILNLSTRIIDNRSISTSKKLIFVWSILIFCATNHHILTADDLIRFKTLVTEMYEKLSNQDIGEQYYRILTFTANWLGRDVAEYSDKEKYLKTSELQTQYLEILKIKYKDLHFEEEQSINGLPPCDIMIRDKKIVIEIQGMFHFLDLERTLRNGRTIIKNQLYRNRDYHVIELKVVDGKISDNEMERCMNSIDEIIKKSQLLPKVEF